MTNVNDSFRRDHEIIKLEGFIFLTCILLEYNKLVNGSTYINALHIWPKKVYSNSNRMSVHTPLTKRWKIQTIIPGKLPSQ